MPETLKYTEDEAHICAENTSFSCNTNSTQEGNNLWQIKSFFSLVKHSLATALDPHTVSLDRREDAHALHVTPMRGRLCRGASQTNLHSVRDSHFTVTQIPRR